MHAAEKTPYAPQDKNTYTGRQENWIMVSVKYILIDEYCVFLPDLIDSSHIFTDADAFGKSIGLALSHHALMLTTEDTI